MDAKQTAPRTAMQPPQEENERLLTLVGELLKTNEELRQRVKTLEQNLSATSVVYQLLLP